LFKKEKSWRRVYDQVNKVIERFRSTLVSQNYIGINMQMILTCGRLLGYTANCSVAYEKHMKEREKYRWRPWILRKSMTKYTGLYSNGTFRFCSANAVVTTACTYIQIYIYIYIYYIHVIIWYGKYADERIGVVVTGTRHILDWMNN